MNSANDKVHPEMSRLKGAVAVELLLSPLASLTKQIKKVLEFIFGSGEGFAIWRFIKGTLSFPL